MCFKIPVVKPTPTYEEFQIDANTLNSSIRSAISLLPPDIIYNWDYWYYYVSLENWRDIIEDVFLSMPKYVTEKFDCENFALLTASTVSSKYKLNTMGIAVGEVPGGEHGFNIFPARTVAGREFFFLEPQTADIIPVAGSDYKPRMVIIG